MIARVPIHDPHETHPEIGSGPVGIGPADGTLHPPGPPYHALGGCHAAANRAPLGRGPPVRRLLLARPAHHDARRAAPQCGHLFADLRASRRQVDLAGGNLSGRSHRLGFQQAWRVVALRAMQRILAGGHSVGITPDGPRGPRMRAKPGAIKTAQLSGAPIVPVSGSVNRRRILGSWDRFAWPCRSVAE